MKTAVSVPNPVFQAGERLAQHLGISRSQLYSRALREYVKRHDEDEITRRLNEVYANESSEPDPVIAKIAAQALSKESQAGEAEPFYGFKPLPRRGEAVSNEVIDRLREEEPE